MNYSEFKDIFESELPVKVEEMYDFGNRLLVSAKHSEDEFDTWYTMDKKTKKIEHYNPQENFNMFITAVNKPQLEF